MCSSSPTCMKEEQQGEKWVMREHQPRVFPAWRGEARCERVMRGQGGWGRDHALVGGMMQARMLEGRNGSHVSSSSPTCMEGRSMMGA